MTRAELEQIAREAAAQYNLPADVFLRLINQESGYKVDAISPKGAYGPAQLMPDTAAELGVNREDPRENIFGGAKYLSQLLNQFGEMPLALAAYNAGMGNVEKYGGVPPFKETQNYLKAILGSTDGQPLSAMRNDAMVGNIQTPPIFPPQKQQQQGGLRGLLQNFMAPNQTTGLTGPENFAQALDALILPQARMGEQIRARGAQRLQTQSRNKTIETLKQRAAQGDKLAAMVLQGLQSGAYDAKTAMSLYMGKMLETPKDARTSMIKNYEYWLSKGKSPEEAEALSKTQPLVDMSTTDKGLQEWDIDFTKSVFADESNASKQLATVRRQIELSQQPDFTAGAGSELIQTGKALLKRFGIDTEVSSNEEFVALMRQQVLDRLGGSLGVGISASDVEYLDAMQANPNMDARTIRNMLLATEAILVRQQEIADFARQYMTENNLRTLSQIDFSSAVREHFANKPIFGE
jgi:hypothetical protein